MNIKLYHKIIENPALLNADTLKGISDLVENYPMVENFRILYALNLLVLDDYRYEKALTKAAIYSTDRRKLKKWVNYILQQEETEEKDDFILTEAEDSIEEIEEIKEEVVLPTNDTSSKEEPKELGTETKIETEIFSEIQEEEKIEPENSIEQKERVSELEPSQKDLLEELIEENLEEEKKKIRSKKELLQLVQNRLKEIEQEKQAEENESEEVSKSKLIDQFIAKAPSISRPDKNEFYDPQNEAMESTMDEDDFFVTETLAQIHTQQGNLKKAIEIYQKLILKNPEKSSYFAAQIEKLTKK